MNQKRVILAAVLLGLAGCGPTPKPSPAAPPVPPGAIVVPASAAPHANVPATMPVLTPPTETTGRGVADAIARQADAHAQAIEALLAAREQEEIARRAVEAATSKSSGAKPPDVKYPETKAPPENPPTPKPPTGTPSRPSTLPDPEIAPTTIEATAANPNEGISVPEKRPLDLTPTGPPRPPADTPHDDLENILAARVKDDPRDVAAQLDYRLALFLKGEASPQTNDLTGLAGEDRDLVTTILDGLSNFRTNVRNDRNLLLNRKIRPLLDMSDQLRAHADLALANLAVCSKVSSFGVYNPFDAATIPNNGMSPRPAIFYCEVDNFASRVSEKNNFWQTKMRLELVLYTGNGLIVWRDEKVLYADETRAKRRDYFMARRFDLPAAVPGGKYILKATVTDLSANRVAEQSLNVLVK